MKMQTPDTPADTVPDPADIAIAQAEARRRHHWHCLIAGGIASSMMSYVLSAGPATLLDKQGFIPGSVRPLLLLAYLPLAWAYQNFEWVRYFYDVYFRLLGIGV